jgi:hypothetical protein
VLCEVVDVLCVCAGDRRQSARRLALIAGLLSLSDIPLGMTLGIYTLKGLLPTTALQH